MGMAVSGVYEYDIGGVQQAPITGATLYNVKTGPFQLKQDADGVKLANLNEVTLTSVDGKTVYAGSRTYPLSDTVAVYELPGQHLLLLLPLPGVRRGLHPHRLL